MSHQLGYRIGGIQGCIGGILGKGLLVYLGAYGCTGTRDMRCLKYMRHAGIGACGGILC